MTKKCKNTQKIAQNWEGGPGMTTWFYRGVGQMTMFDHDGGGGSKFPKNLTTWYMDDPIWTFICIEKLFFKLPKYFFRNLLPRIIENHCKK